MALEKQLQTETGVKICSDILKLIGTLECYQQSVPIGYIVLACERMQHQVGRVSVIAASSKQICATSIAFTW